ncbi:MAG: hypothetical protein Q9170_001331 [Blastenia crenularia]
MSQNGNTEPLQSSITVSKPIPYTFDLGNLLISDANPLPTRPSEAQLSATARDCAQALVNQLLTTCPITSSSEGVLMTLPPPTTPLPREKPLPAVKAPTKWEQFAAKKGIKDKKKEGKLVFDEETQEWVPKWGYKGKNKEGEQDWIVEIDEKKEKKGAEGSDAGLSSVPFLPSQISSHSLLLNQPVRHILNMGCIYTHSYFFYESAVPKSTTPVISKTNDSPILQIDNATDGPEKDYEESMGPDNEQETSKLPLEQKSGAESGASGPKQGLDT